MLPVGYPSPGLPLFPRALASLLVGEPAIADLGQDAWGLLAEERCLELAKFCCDLFAAVLSGPVEIRRTLDVPLEGNPSLAQLARLDLSFRSSRALSRTVREINEGTEYRRINDQRPTVLDLSRVRSLGPKALLEVLCAYQQALDDGTLQPRARQSPRDQ